MPIETLRWTDAGLIILDQRLLPSREEYITLATTDGVCDAIGTLAVRGAPAIGVAAAYGVVISAREQTERGYVELSIARLRATRPTAVNLFFALDALSATLDDAFDSPDPVGRLLDRARALHDEDMRICRELSFHGAELLSDGDTVLTHCNAGALATSGYGTALGVIYAAKEQGKRISVFADETRPLLQGGRLTAWELARNGIPVTIICDNMAAVILRQGGINRVITGADRIARNGDTANKIGTYGLAVMANYHDVPVTIAAPLTSFDPACPSGVSIPIEERSSQEIYRVWSAEPGNGIAYYNPAFDVTPAELIDSIVSERGVARTPFGSTIARWLGKTDTGTPERGLV